jgi:hypothetical protein
MKGKLSLIQASALILISISSQGQWTEHQKLLASDGAEGDKHGISTCIDGDIAIVGAYEEGTNGDFSGAAYVYSRNQGGSNNWGEVKKLLAPDGDINDRFGFYVSLSGSTAAVGAPWDSDNGAQSGAVYIFNKDEGGLDNWGFVRKVTQSDGVMGDYFGYSLSLSEDKLLVGAYFDDDNGSQSGSAYIYYQNTGGINNWGEVQKITSSDGSSNDHFGVSVSLNGSTALIGARFDDDNGANSGSAYIFEQDEGGVNNWGEVEKLISDDGSNYDQFGISVSVEGDLALVGCHLDDDLGLNAGAAYVFGRDEGGNDNWGQVDKLLPSDGMADDQFGISVSLSGPTALVGSHQANVPDDNEGAAYFFGQDVGGNGQWGESQKISSATASPDCYFAYSVSLSDSTGITGAWNDSELGAESGAAFIFGPELSDLPGCMDATACNYNPDASVSDGSCEYLDGCTCPGDFSGDGQINTPDLLIFLGAFGCSAGCPVDLNNDDYTDTLDLLSFLPLIGSDCE